MWRRRRWNRRCLCYCRRHRFRLRPRGRWQCWWFVWRDNSKSFAIGCLAYARAFSRTYHSVLDLFFHLFFWFLCNNPIEFDAISSIISSKPFRMFARVLFINAKNEQSNRFSYRFSVELEPEPEPILHKQNNCVSLRIYRDIGAVYMGRLIQLNHFWKLKCVRCALETKRNEIEIIHANNCVWFGWTCMCRSQFNWFQFDFERKSIEIVDGGEQTHKTFSGNLAVIKIENIKIASNSTRIHLRIEYYVLLSAHGSHARNNETPQWNFAKLSISSDIRFDSPKFNKYLFIRNVYMYL